MTAATYLWDEPATRFAVVFVGGEGCHTVLRREPMLSSRVFIRQHFTRLTPEEVQQIILLFYPIRADADPDDIAFADSHAAHSNFRARAQLTAHTRTALVPAALAWTGCPRKRHQRQGGNTPMLKLGKNKRPIAMAAATLAVADGATIGLGGTAHADSTPGH